MEDWQLWLSIGALVAGLLLILLEVMNPGFFIAVPGTVLAGFGLFALIAPDFFYSGAPAAITIVLFFVLGTLGTLWAYKRWAPPGDRPVTLSNDSLPGQHGVVERAIPADDAGRIRVEGQSLRAVADEAIEAGSKVTIIKADGLTVTVTRSQ